MPLLAYLLSAWTSRPLDQLDSQQQFFASYISNDSIRKNLLLLSKTLETWPVGLQSDSDPISTVTIVRKYLQHQLFKKSPAALRTRPFLSHFDSSFSVILAFFQQALPAVQCENMWEMLLTKSTNLRLVHESWDHPETLTVVFFCATIWMLTIWMLQAKAQTCKGQQIPSPVCTAMRENHEDTGHNQHFFRLVEKTWPSQTRSPGKSSRIPLAACEFSSSLPGSWVSSMRYQQICVLIH